MSQSKELIRKVAVYAEAYMNNFHGSHDFSHIKRVLGMSRQIAAEIERTCHLAHPMLDPTLIALAALLHDIGDR